MCSSATAICSVVGSCAKAHRNSSFTFSASGRLSLAICSARPPPRDSLPWISSEFKRCSAWAGFASLARSRASARPGLFLTSRGAPAAVLHLLAHLGQQIVQGVLLKTPVDEVVECYQR